MYLLKSSPLEQVKFCQPDFPYVNNEDMLYKVIVRICVTIVFISRKSINAVQKIC